jgi:hypothetical protein
VLAAHSNVFLRSCGVDHLLGSESQRSQRFDHDMIGSLRTEGLDVEKQHIDLLVNLLGNSRDVVLQLVEADDEETILSRAKATPHLGNLGYSYNKKKNKLASLPVWENEVQMRIHS